MNSSHRTFVITALGLLLLGTAGWFGLKKGEDVDAVRDRAAGPVRSLDPVNDKERRASRRGESKSILSGLPPHLRKLVLVLENRAAILDENRHWKEVRQAVRDLRPLFADLATEDLVKLIEFYEDMKVSEKLRGYGLASSELLGAWGRRDPDAAVDRYWPTLARALEAGRDGEPHLTNLKWIYQGMALQNPREAWHHWNERIGPYRPVEAAPNRRSIVSGVRSHIIGSWAEVAPREAWAALQDSNQVHSDARDRLLMPIFFDHLEPDAPWAWIREQVEALDPGPPYRASLFAASWARHDPNEAVRWLIEFNVLATRQMFDQWHEDDESGQAIDWLVGHVAGLPPNLHSFAAEAVVRHRAWDLANMLTVVGSLPRDPVTWRFLEDLAGASTGTRAFIAQGDIDQAPTLPSAMMGNPLPLLPPEVVRSLVAKLEPPKDVRNRIDGYLAEREAHSDAKRGVR